MGADDGVNPGAYSVIAVLEYRRPKRRYWDPSKSVYVHELVQRWQFDAGVGSTVVYFRMGNRWWCAVDSAVYLESSILRSCLVRKSRLLGRRAKVILCGDLCMGFPLCERMLSRAEGPAFVVRTLQLNRGPYQENPREGFH